MLGMYVIFYNKFVCLFSVFLKWALPLLPRLPCNIVAQADLKFKFEVILLSLGFDYRHDFHVEWSFPPQQFLT